MTHLVNQTCLASENSGLMGREYHAERSAILTNYGHHPHGQRNGQQTHPNHHEHVEAIEKGRDYLPEAWFGQDDSKRQVTPYRDHLSKTNLMSV